MANLVLLFIFNAITIAVTSYACGSRSLTRIPASWPGGGSNGVVQSIRPTIIDDMIPGNRSFIQADIIVIRAARILHVILVCVVCIVFIILLSSGFPSSSGRGVLSSIRFISFCSLIYGGYSRNEPASILYRYTQQAYLSCNEGTDSLKSLQL